jgi:hypothetical protein
VVQVDVFWSYALGAGLACAAHRELEREETPSESKYFVRTLLFLSVLFAPSGIYLLWNFPGWETMFVWDRSIPAWLVTGFAITNVTQGVLGFFVCYWLIRKGRIYAANLQWLLGYLVMFFILVHGWDGTGFRRFLYSGTIEQWRAGIDIPIYRFFISEVLATLLVMGLVLLPVLFRYLAIWTREGYEREGLILSGVPVPGAVQIVKSIFFSILVGTLGFAIAASILVHLLGWFLGLGLFFAIYYAFGIRKGGILHKQISLIVQDERV